MTSNQGSDVEFYTYQQQAAEAEDAEVVNWVDAQLAEAENNGTLYEVALNLAGDMNLATPDVANAFAQVDPANAPEAPAVPPTREEIRERIFAKLRRPDGTPYAAGYTQGPAARKAQYENETERSGAWRNRANPDNTNFVTQYDDRATMGERAASTSDDGRVLDANGAPVSGSWGWVIDEQTGYLMLFDPRAGEATSPEGVTGPLADLGGLRQLLQRGFTVRATHHTTPVAGMPVVGAGMITLDQGRITQITDESGHYRPDAVQQWHAMQELVGRGVDLDAARIQLTGREMAGNRPTDKQGWIDAAQQTNPDFPTGDVSLTPEQFAQTGGDEYQIRMKQALNEQIRGRGETPAAAEGTGTAEPTGYAAPYYPGDQSDQPPIYVQDQSANYNTGDPAAQPNPLRDSTAGDNYNNLEDNYQNLDDEPAVDPQAHQQANDQWLADARAFLADQGRAAFTDWFGTLPRENQDMLTNDPHIAALLSAVPAGAAPAAPTASDHEAIDAANEAAVKALDDRGATPFTVAGTALLIGGGHRAAHVSYAQSAADSASGSVTVRKSGLGRGAGSLTFRGVPPAKQEIVRAAVARFSDKTVEFA